MDLGSNIQVHSTALSIQSCLRVFRSFVTSFPGIWRRDALQVSELQPMRVNIYASTSQTYITLLIIIVHCLICILRFIVFAFFVIMLDTYRIPCNVTMSNDVLLCLTINPMALRLDLFWILNHKNRV